MSVNWQDSTSPARVKALAAAEASGEFDCTVPTWDIYCDLREALIWALLCTGFPAKSQWAITEKNWEALYIRLNLLERVTGCRRVYNNGDLAPREMFFTPEEVRSVIGLSVNAGNKSEAEFKKYLMNYMMDDANVKLETVTLPNDRRIEDPYYWEKLFVPVASRPVCNNLPAAKS